MIELPMVFVAGILGTAHCLGMCGPFALAIGGTASGWSSALTKQSLYTLGRVFTYGILGAIAGFCGTRLVHSLPTVINIPAALTIALAMSLVPAISAARIAKDQKTIHTVSAMGIKLAMFIGIPCAVGLFALSAPVIDLLYTIDEQRLAIASALMRTSAIGIIFLSLVQTLTGILQGVGKQYVPVINLLIGGVVKVVLMLTLMRNPAIEIQGAAISTVACYTVAGVLDAIYLIRFTKLKLNVRNTFIKPLVAALVMGAAVYVSYALIYAKIASNTLATVGAILIGISLYLTGVIWMQMFSAEDFALMPGGSTLAKLQFRRK